MKIEVKDYTNYSAEELLGDDYFVQSHKHPSPESESFWQEHVLSGKVLRKEYEQACFVLASVTIKKEEIPSDKEEEIWQRITQTNRRTLKIRRFRIGAAASVAASLLIILLFNITQWYSKEATDDSLYLLSQTEVPASSNEIQLILPEKSITIQGQTSDIQYDANGNVVVNSEKVQESPADAENSFSQLIVPNGKRSTLVLEDGTKMWVNAGSRIIYPTKFEKGKREIYVDGEAYLEVAHEKARPFIVKTHAIDVEVLGTVFNVTAYKKDAQSSVVLASGSVRVGTRDEKVRLVPNEMFSYSPQGGSQVQQVTVSDYISWKDGIYTYHSEPLSSILNRISRYYGEEIAYDPDIATYRCSGKLDLQDNLDSLLSGLTHTVPVDFVKRDGKYTFEKRNK